MTRTYSFPEGHWNWPVQLTHKHGVRHSEMIYTGGQVDLDPQGNVLNPDVLEPQVRSSMNYLRIVLEDLNASLQDLVKIVVFYTGDTNDEWHIQEMIAEIIGKDVKPVLNLVPKPELCYPHMRCEIEGVAMANEDGSSVPRHCHYLAEMPKLHQAFSHVIQSGEMIFTSDMSTMRPDGTIEEPGALTAQTQLMMERLNECLSAVGADCNDVCQLDLFYVDSAAAEDWEAPALIRAGFFAEPGPAATGVPVESFAHDGLCTKIFVTAMRGSNGEKLEKTYAWPERHWDWTVHLPYKHGNKCGRMIHMGGQVSLDQNANVIDPDDMVAQTKTAMNYIRDVLAEFGATLDDVIKVRTFYQGTASAEALHENLLIRSKSYTEPGPATTGVPVPCLVYPSMVIEIEIIAMVD
ncbi:Rid family hydrolase [Alphaproteobacteria bacterium]|nr:Rid family hydrolase [Alphaproteobacteria bacterium]